MMKSTPWKEYTERGQKFRIKATYGLDYEFARGSSQAPYFSVTAVIERGHRNGRWTDYSAGTQHDAIIRHFAGLSSYLKWHLVSTQEPMHYLANAKYWWEKMTGTSKWKSEPHEPNPENAFRSAIVYGGVPGDRMPGLDEPWPHVAKWLTTRLPQLMGHFTADMAALGVLE
jgi:hypothetical protein